MRGRAPILIWLCLWAWSGPVLGQNKCCPGAKNVLRNRTCQDGAKVTGVTCRSKYMLSPETTGNFTIDGNGRLVEEGVAPVAKDRYCLTKETEDGVDVALVCFEETPQDYFQFRAACSFISLIFLAAAIVIYFLVPTLRDLQGTCLLHSIVSLALAMLLLGLLQFGVPLEGLACPTVGYVTFAAFLVAFTWLNVVSFHIWKSTVIPEILGTDRQWYFLYCAWGYGLPALIIIAAIVGHHVPGNHIKPEIGFQTCWFSGRQSTWAYFYGPITFLLLVNVLLFLWTVKTLWKDMKQLENNAAKIRSLKYKCLMYIKLFFIMGLSWIFEVISFASENQSTYLDYVWMLTDFVNGLQGVFIFVVLIACRKRALKGLAQRGLGCFRLPEQWKTLHDEECDELMEDAREMHKAVP